MSIGNMPEDELDDLFRQAASGHHPEFDPEAWEAMEKKLEAPAGVTAPATSRLRLGGLIVLLLLVGLTTWLGYHYQTQDKVANKNTPMEKIATAGHEPQKTPGAKQTAVPAVVASPGGGETGARPTNDIAGNNETTRLNTGAATSNRPSESIGAGIPAKVPPTRLGRRNQTVKTKTTPVLAAAQNDTGKRADIIAEKSTRIDTRLTDAPAVNDKINNQLPAADSVASPTILPPVAFLPDSSQVADKTKQQDNTEKKRQPGLALHRFTLSVMAAPDLSTVGFANPGGISTNAGITIGYSLNDKWSLATGIIKARKIYDAKPGDYGNKYYWYNRHQPDAISAVCQVLDIPLNIGYNFWQRNKSVLTVQTGLSSYLMLNEKYTYEYLPYGGRNGYSSNYEVENKNRHLFSIYNLSGRYSYCLAPGVTAGVEPFVKVPLSGVGAGKVKLASAGVFFSLSYRYPQ